MCTYPFVQLPFKVIIIYVIIKKHLFGELPHDPPKKNNQARLIKRVFEEEKKKCEICQISREKILKFSYLKQ